MRKDGRPDHIEDALCAIQVGQWFTWSDSKNKIYKNIKLIPKVWIDGKEVDNPITKIPSESEINEKLIEIQKAWDNAENKKVTGLNKLKELGLSDEELTAMGLK
tara:strand:+ start:196 stop:507 length:312 start_codon:yes stop_codon:yes gene_type:complete